MHTEQLAQNDCPEVYWKVPCGHWSQEVAPLWTVILPGSQARHCPCCGSGLLYPGGLHADCKHKYESTD